MDRPKKYLHYEFDQKESIKIGTKLMERIEKANKFDKDGKFIENSEIPKLTYFEQSFMRGIYKMQKDGINPEKMTIEDQFNGFKTLSLGESCSKQKFTKQKVDPKQKFSDFISINVGHDHRLSEEQKQFIIDEMIVRCVPMFIKEFKSECIGPLLERKYSGLLGAILYIFSHVLQDLFFVSAVQEHKDYKKWQEKYPTVFGSKMKGFMNPGTVHLFVDCLIICVFYDLYF